MYVAEIVGVSESEFDAILSEKFPPNGKRGTAACTIQPLVRVYKTISSISCIVQHKVRQFIIIQLMSLTCLDAEGVLVVSTKEQVLYNSI